MNATTSPAISSLKDEIKKTQDTKKKEKLKIIAAILLSNCAVAMICLPSGEIATQKEIISKTLHREYQMMTIPAQALVTVNEDKEIPVTIISRDKKIIAARAFLHEEINSNNGGEPQIKVEIASGDVMRVSSFTAEGMMAIPYTEIKAVKKLTNIKRGSRYEVSL